MEQARSASAGGRGPSTRARSRRRSRRSTGRCAILKVLAEGEGMSLTELAEASGQAPATVYRVLSTFEAHGIVEVQPATQLWFVGQEAFRIGSAFLGRTSLVEQARGVMHALMAETGETANLAIADGGQVVFISQVETHEPIRAFFRPGTRGPIHASGHRQGAARLPCRRRRWRGSCASRGSPAFTRADDHRPGAARRRSWRRSGRGAGRWTTRSGPRGCAASRRRSSTSSARRSPGCRSRGRRCGWRAPAGAALGARVRAAADRITRAIGGTAP